MLQTLSNPFKAARYHSLVIEKESCPDVLEVTAWTEDGTIMAVQHKDLQHIQVLLLRHSTKICRLLLPNTRVEDFVNARPRLKALPRKLPIDSMYSMRS